MEGIQRFKFLRPKGFYKSLKVFKYTTVIYDLTYAFQERFLKTGDRTKDQMAQSARAGKQNIAEGSEAGRVSKYSEILLINVARASLQELLQDYEDYLRTRNLEKWGKEDERTLRTRKIVTNKINNYSEEVEKYFIQVGETRSDESLANICITMIHMADSMLAGLQKRQERDFLEEGGMKEQMHKARLEARAHFNRGGKGN